MKYTVKICSVLMILILIIAGSPNIFAQKESIESVKNEFVDLYNQSQDCLSKGDYDKAISLKGQAYNKCKDITEMKLLCGLCAMELAQIYSLVYQNYNKYIFWLYKSDSCGVPNASGLLGDAYLTGKSGVAQDYSKAKFFYEKSEEGRCKWILATMYSENGEFGKNDSEWLKYATQAVEKNDPDAQYVLGRFYLEGKIVDKNLKKGIDLIKKAAGQNYIKAIRFLQEQNNK